MEKFNHDGTSSVNNSKIDSTGDPDVAGAALNYIKSKISVVPVQRRSKVPVAYYWGGKKAAIVTEHNVAEAFKDGRNVGGQLGPKSDGLVDIDLDCVEARELAHHFLPATSAVFGRKSAPSSHWMYRSNLQEIEPVDRIQVEGMIELRIGGGNKNTQTVIPPSIHETGENIEWVDGPFPVFTQVDGKQLLRCWYSLATATIGARYWPRAEGNRNNVTMAFSGSLARTGKMDVDDAADIVEHIMAYAGDDPKDYSSRLATVRRTFQKHERGEKITGLKSLQDFFGEEATKRLAKLFNYGNYLQDDIKRMNAEYCVVRHDGKVRIMHFDHQMIEGHKREVARFLTASDFSLFYRNDIVWTENAKGKPSPEPIANVWLKHPERRQYEGLCFQPSTPTIEVINGRLNLWRGFGVESKPGDWSLMQAHIKEIIASNEKEWHDYILHWLAWAVQHPEVPAEVALVLRGKPGTGKGALFNAMCRIFGQHGLHISNSNHLAGHFNAHLRDCCFLFADEALYPGDKKGLGTLKSLLTEPTIAIEAKGFDTGSAENRLHIAMASNETWVVPAGHDERRYAMFDISDTHMQDQNWFEPLFEQMMKHGGDAAMLHALLNLDLSGWHPRVNVPQTEALLEQQELTTANPFTEQIEPVLGELTGKISNHSLWEILNVSVERRHLYGARLNEAMRELRWRKSRLRVNGDEVRRCHVKGKEPFSLIEVKRELGMLMVTLDGKVVGGSSGANTDVEDTPF